MEQLELLRFGVSVLERLGLPYALVGSYGTLAYGEARFTQDIDIVVDLPDERSGNSAPRLPRRSGTSASRPRVTRSAAGRSM